MAEVKQTHNKWIPLYHNLFMCVSGCVYMHVNSFVFAVQVEGKEGGGRKDGKGEQATKMATCACIRSDILFHLYV